MTFNVSVKANRAGLTRLLEVARTSLVSRRNMLPRIMMSALAAFAMVSSTAVTVTPTQAKTAA